MLPQPKGYSKLPLLMLVVQVVVVVGGGSRGHSGPRAAWACPLGAPCWPSGEGRGHVCPVCARYNGEAARSTARGLRRKILLGLGYFTVWFPITPK